MGFFATGDEMIKRESGVSRVGRLEDTRADVRCRCGNMIGQLTSRGIEVKCRRCKRIHIIPRSVIEGCCAVADSKPESPKEHGS